MRVLIIPDVHLKHWMFDDADRILKDKLVDKAVVLGDIVDDFGQDGNEALYKETLDRAIQFKKDHPDTLWCRGNHDMAYLWAVPCSGTSRFLNVQDTAIKGLCDLYYTNEVIDDDGPACNDNAAFVHRIDNVLFSHAGVSRMFVREHRGNAGYDNVEAVIRNINQLGMSSMWYDDSPIWLRPQKIYTSGVINMYKPKTFLQVVGHSPMKEITREGNLISCDTFSTYRNGIPYGNEAFCILDTKTHGWRSIPSSRLGMIRAYEKLGAGTNILAD